jgi:hypothetical protein
MVVILKEKSIFKMNGFVALLFALICIIVGIYLFYNTLSVGGQICAIVVIILGLIIATSLTIVQPNEANQKVIISFDTVETLLSISNKVLRSRATKNL